MPRFVVDAHTHSLRFRPGLLKKGEEWSYRTLEQKIYTTEPWDNSPILLQDMERHGVDFCLLSSAFNMRNEMILEQVRANPHRFLGLCNHTETTRKVQSGEKKFDVEAAVEEIDRWLEYPEFVGVGEAFLAPDPDPLTPMEQNLKHLCRILEVVKKHRVPIMFHTGWIRYPQARLRACDPLWVDDLAVMYPEVPIVIGHMGVQAGWYRIFPENALMVAGRHPNVYLETSQGTAEQIERAYLDPHIGADKILFGSDYGTSIAYARVGDQTFAVTSVPPTYLPDHFAWNLKQIYDVTMPEDDRNKLLGLNAARLFGISVRDKIAEQKKRWARGG